MQNVFFVGRNMAARAGVEKNDSQPWQYNNTKPKIDEYQPMQNLSLAEYETNRTNTKPILSQQNRQRAPNSHVIDTL